jgi:2-keto-3-deoxygluconate permease
MLPIKKTIERVPGGMMIVPLFVGSLIGTIDKMHLQPVMDLLAWMGTKPIGTEKLADGSVRQLYEALFLGGDTFWQKLFSKEAVLTLVALFLFCASSQMNLRIGGRALLKGSILVSAKWLVGVIVALLWGWMSGDVYQGFLGLGVMTIIAAMTNGNGGMYAALTGQYGNRSDTGALSLLSLNDGPFLTLVGLTVLGAVGLLHGGFPTAYLVATILPILIGMLLGNLDEDIRTFLAPGEKLLIPFFAFALGTNMNLANFLKGDVVAGGIVLGVMTTVITGGFGMLMYRLFGFRSQIAPIAEASTAGNATFTPVAIAGAAVAAVEAAKLHGLDTTTLQTVADSYTRIKDTAVAQISIAVITTALLCPVLVAVVDRWQRRRGIDGTQEQ